MAQQPRWKRYRRPGDPRTEDGTPATPRTPTAPKKPAAPTAPKKPAAPTSRNRPWLVAGVVVAVVGVIALVAVLARGGDDGPARNEVDTEVLDGDFVTTALAHAVEAAPGQQPVSVRLDEYGLSVEYFDPNTEVVRTIETAHYDPDGYRVRNRENEYDDYAPGRFPLDLAAPGAMIDQVRAALDRAEGAWAWRLEIQVDPASRDVVMTTDVSASDAVEVSDVLRTGGATP
ncbi:hypothetical protein ACFJIY_06555 [Pimelobacter simplex]|uniref:hypothetical protein n=1 Tax=Nocardioides simplex TaxID=2045 RepID=UPI0036721943